MATEYLGAVKIFAGNYAPKGYALAQGQQMSIQQNTALFSLYGTTYGGNGISTFGLPDLRSRLPIGQGNGQGLTPRIIGEISGSENVTLLSSNVPTHNHVFNATTTAASTATAGPTVLLGTLEGTQTFYATAGATNVRPVQISPLAIGVMGGNTPHNNIQPSMGLTFIVCLSGVFPSRN